MRYISTLLLPSLFALYLHAEYLDSYAAVVEKIKKENKIGVILMISGHCRWCTNMREKTLKDPKIVKALEKDFIIGIIHKERDSTYPKYLKPNFVPMTYFLNPKEEVINETFGFKKADYFLDDIERAKYMFAPN